MTVQTDAFLKTRFETNDQPTATDFGDLIDSKVHVNNGLLFLRDNGELLIDRTGELLSARS